MKTVQPKTDKLPIESLGFIARISSAGHFSSPRLTTNFLVLVTWRIASPTSSWEVLSQWANMLPSPAVSCCTSQLTHSVVASLVWSSLVECLHLGSMSLTALRETPSHCLASASWASPHWEQTASAASASLFALRTSTNTNFVLVCKHNAKPDPWQWVFSESSHHVCELPL